MIKAKKGDIVVLMKDTAANFVPKFERFIGAVGEVVDSSYYGRPSVKFGEETWFYADNQLFKLGSVESAIQD